VPKARVESGLFDAKAPFQAPHPPHAGREQLDRKKKRHVRRFCRAL
jgi:hypothetical protein